MIVLTVSDPGSDMNAQIVALSIEVRGVKKDQIAFTMVVIALPSPGLEMWITLGSGTQTVVVVL